MLKLKDIYVGQLLFIKSFEKCIEEGYVLTFDNDDYWEFINIKHNPGVNRDMRDLFGKPFIIDSIQDNYIHFSNCSYWVWPIEVLTTYSSSLKKLKIS